MFHTVYPFREELRFGHFRLLVESQDPEALKKLQLDFQLCASHLPSAGSQKTYVLQLVQQPLISKPKGWFKFRAWRASGMGAKRTIFYLDGSTVHTDAKRNITQIFASKSSRLHELGYLFILSIVGKEWDMAGYHRVHGLGVHFPESGSTALFVMDSGTGKSTLALSLQKYLPRESFQIFSDEIPLLRRRMLYPFPIRAAFSEITLRILSMSHQSFPIFARQGYSPKCLMNLNEISSIAPPSKLTHLVFCTRSSTVQRPHLLPCSKLMIFYSFLNSSVVGVGVPQMAEHFLRFDLLGLMGLARVAVSRFLNAVEVSLKTPAYRLTLCHSPELNVEWVKRLLGHIPKQAVPRPRIWKKPFFTPARNGRVRFDEQNSPVNQPEL